MSTTRNIIVVGSGVIGLTCAVGIQERFENARVKIIAEMLAGDPQHIEYTSSWAGAHNVPVSDNTLQKQLEQETFAEIWQLARKDPSLPLMITPCTAIYDAPPGEGRGQTLLRLYMPDFAVMNKSELPAGAVEGYTFSTVTYDTPKWLLFLAQRFEAAGGTFERRKLSHIREALPADVIINCTGLGARKLGGVEDHSLYPIRGQTVMVRAPWMKRAYGRKGASETEVSYVIPRKCGDVICGGTTEADDWHPEPRPTTSKRIKEDAIKLCPELLPPDKRSRQRIEDLDVIRDGCGLRPGRRGGIRLERDAANLNGSVPLIHAYGHAGAGFQSSLGTAARVADLVKDALKQ